VATTVTGEETGLTRTEKTSSPIFYCDEDKIASVAPPWEISTIKF
jgi:hypothetical protein